MQQFPKEVQQFSSDEYINHPTLNQEVSLKRYLAKVKLVNLKRIGYSNYKPCLPQTKHFICPL
jgi:hypothetical protein